MELPSTSRALRLLVVLQTARMARGQQAPAPPHNLPPWAPGAMPPVPGPVFSKAFNALLVLMVFGCIFLYFNLRESIKKLYASDIGEDNELLTRGGAGNAQWLAGIQKTQGRHKGHCSEIAPVVMPKAKSKKGGKGKSRRELDDDDADEEEMRPMPKPKAKKGKK